MHEPAGAPGTRTGRAAWQAHQPVRVVSESLGHLDSQPVRKVCFGVIAHLLEALYRIASRLTHRHDLKCYNIYLAALYGCKVVGEAQALVFELPGAVETGNLAFTMSF